MLEHMHNNYCALFGHIPMFSCC